MPSYDFQYTKDDGTVVTVEQWFSMQERPDTIQVVDADGRTYEARHVILRPPAAMKLNWQVKGTVSDLPDENSRFITKDELPGGN